MARCDDAVHPPAQTYVRYQSDDLCRRASVLMSPALMLENGTGYGMNKVMSNTSNDKEDNSRSANAPTVGRHS
jgi:hypothetical protein